MTAKGLRMIWAQLVFSLVMLMAACQTLTMTPDPKLAALRQQERATLPNVTTVQKWQAIANTAQSVPTSVSSEATPDPTSIPQPVTQPISKPENSAPSIIPLDNGDYRMYWNAPSLNGIGSAVTPAGLRFNAEDGARLINAPAGQMDCAIGKPWVIPVVNGYRMYYQGQPDNCNAPVTTLVPNSRIFSAFSSDGRDFTRDPGVRIDLGGVMHLSAAGHGRVIQKDDGSFRMFFTGLLSDKGSTPYIMSATSIDTLEWMVDAKPLLEGAHDPTALQVESTIQLYVSYMTDNVLLLESTDGVTFTPTAWLEFYDTQNNLITQMSDLDIIDLPDGSLIIYGSGTGTKGIMSFKQTTS
jgi:hypothetical protein